MKIYLASKKENPLLKQGEDFLNFLSQKKLNRGNRMHE